MKIMITLTELGRLEKLRSVKDIKESLQIGLYEAKSLLDAIIESRNILSPKEVEEMPKSTKHVKFRKEPKPRKRFPREMMVSENKIDWDRKLVYSTMRNLENKEKRYITAFWPSEDRTVIGESKIHLLRVWKYAKEIE